MAECCLFFTLVCIAVLCILFLFIRWRLQPKPRQKRSKSDKASILVVVGSGGHTKEILMVTEKLGAHYSPRHYIVAASDQISIEKIHVSEKASRLDPADVKYDIHTIPRSREVRQSWITTIFTTLYASLYSLPLVFCLRPEVILCNGPGTCIPICFAGLLLKILGIRDTMIIYVESICRVETLSLSAKILYNFADYLIVQWPELAAKYPKCKYIGKVF